MGEIADLDPSAVLRLWRGGGAVLTLHNPDEVRVSYAHVGQEWPIEDDSVMRSSVPARFIITLNDAAVRSLVAQLEHSVTSAAADYVEQYGAAAETHAQRWRISPDYVDDLKRALRVIADGLRARLHMKEVSHDQ